MKKIIRLLLFTMLFALCITLPASASVSSEVKALRKGKTYTVSGYSRVSSDNTTVASAKKASSKNYTITALKKGKALIKCYNGKGTVKKKIYLIVTNSSSFKYDTSKLTLEPNQSKTVKASVQSGCTVKYVSSSTSVATVNSNGKITAKKTGTAVIKAKVYYRGVRIKTMSKTVKVAKKTSSHSWQITQYGSSRQEMCYTITNGSKLIIVDGGYDEKQLRKIISKYGNRVDAWIITHAHPDHINAFLKIYKNPKGIKIKKVYTVESPDQKTLKSTGESESHINTWKKFRNLKISNLTYVHAGDSWKISGLKFEVLSAYNDNIKNEVLERGGNLLNDGSMVFRVSTANESMLFTSDVGNKMTDELVAQYGESLKADYVQMAHHGKIGLEASFYELVNPKAAFFDCGKGELNLTTVKTKLDLISSLGGKAYTFKTTPNRITLK